MSWDGVSDYLSNKHYKYEAKKREMDKQHKIAEMRDAINNWMPEYNRLEHEWKEDKWGECFECDRFTLEGDGFVCMKCCNAVLCEHCKPSSSPNFFDKYSKDKRCPECKHNITAAILRDRPHLADIVEGLKTLGVGINIENSRANAIIWKPSPGFGGLDVQYELPE